MSRWTGEWRQQAGCRICLEQYKEAVAGAGNVRNVRGELAVELGEGPQISPWRSALAKKIGRGTSIACHHPQVRRSKALFEEALLKKERPPSTC